MVVPTSLWEQRTLDCPKFAALLRQHRLEDEDGSVRGYGAMQDKQSEAEYWALRQEYEELWRRHLMISLVKNVLVMNGAEHSLAQALVTAESPLGVLAQCGAPSIDNGIAWTTTACESLLSRLLPLSRLLLSVPGEARTLECCQDIVSQVRLALKTIDERQRQTISSCIQIITILADASLQLIDMLEQVTRLIQTVTPLARSYVEVFVQYISAVIKALDLKLQIIEKDTMLGALSTDLTPIQNRRASLAVEETVGIVEATIQQTEANLLLLCQLGPSMETIARQYQQVLSQLALAKEDLCNLLQ